MRPYISEFSYGYALTEELIQSAPAPLTAAPLFPSLIAEGTSGGYDVSIPFAAAPVFFQFKLSDCMVRKRAVEVQKGLLSVPFYRMHLRASAYSDQHKLLLDLEKVGNEVYYAAPLFHQVAEFNAAYLNRKVVQESAFFQPSAIGKLPNHDPHHVAFAKTGTAYFCSRPRKIRDAIVGDAFFENLLRGDRIWKPSQVRMKEVQQQMMEILARHERSKKARREREALFERQRAERSPAANVAFLARTYFSCEVVAFRADDTERTEKLREVRQQ